MVLGNPPWDTLSPDSKEFFSTFDPAVRFVDKSGQDAIIATLLELPSIARAWDSHCRSLYATVHFLKNSGNYVLFAPGNLGKGDFNVYRMFAEMAFTRIRRRGIAAQVLPENFYNGANAMALRRALFDRFDWRILIGFENARETWFPGTDSRLKFCLYAAVQGGRTETVAVAFNVRSPEQLDEARRDLLRLSPKLVREFSPDALAIMELGTQLEIDIASRMYADWPKFGDGGGSPARLYCREVDMGTDRDLLTDERLGLPLYEGRMVSQFDHRAKAYISGRGRAAEWVELSFERQEKSIRPQWCIATDKVPTKLGDRIHRYRIGFCDVASPTNERTLVAALIPPGCVCGHKVPTITFDRGFEWIYMMWLAVANSFTMDFIARRKVSLTMSYTILDSLPFPRLDRADRRAQQVVPLAARLTCTGPEMDDYWDLLASDGWVATRGAGQPAPGLQDPSQRLLAAAELEVLVATGLFGLTREQLDFILDTFPIVRKNDIAAHGEYHTKRVILEIYDEMADAIRTGQPHQTRLDPAPADPRVAHSPKPVERT